MVLVLVETVDQLRLLAFLLLVGEEIYNFRILLIFEVLQEIFLELLADFLLFLGLNFLLVRIRVAHQLTLSQPIDFYQPLGFENFVAFLEEHPVTKFCDVNLIFHLFTVDK